MNRFVSKTVIVTAAASGIGAATARAFAQEGGNVILADIADAAGQALADELGDAGLSARYRHCNATSEEDAAELVAFAVATFGRLDAAVNIVGNLAPGARPDIELVDETAEQFRGTVEVNLLSTFLIALSFM